MSVGAAHAAAFAAFPAAPDLLGFWARVAPGRAALVDRPRGRRVSYAELDAAAARMAGALVALGVRPGDRVAALADNRGELVELFFACGRVGAALVPVNWRLAAAELAPVLADAAPVVLVGEERFRALAEPALAGAPVRWVDVERDLPALVGRAEPLGTARPAAAGDAGLVLYTSGSTGRPKGVVVPRRQLLANAVATVIGWEMSAADVAPVSTPFFHTGGWGVFATALWHCGGTVVLAGRFDPADYLAALGDERCTMAFAVPTQLVMLGECPGWGAPLPALRTLVSGGAPCPPAVLERVRASGYRVHQGYGLTECGPNCFATSHAASLADPGSVGWPVPFLEMRLDAGGGREAAPGEPGELLLRGPQLFAGYLHQPELTAEVMTADGWLRTGDLARRDAGGAYTICGRRKEMYISGGENVFPGEVEAVLADHPGLVEVAVVGVPDPRWGECGCAFVVRRPGADRPPDESAADDVVRFARARLAGYKVPRRVLQVDALPRLGSGKVDRRALVEMAADRGVRTAD